MDRLGSKVTPKHTSTRYSHIPAESACGIFSLGLMLDLVPVLQDGNYMQSQPSASSPFKRRSFPGLIWILLCDPRLWLLCPVPAQPGTESSLWSQTDLPGTPELHYINCWPWTVDLKPSKLSFLICNIRMIRVPTSQGSCEDLMG